MPDMGSTGAEHRTDAKKEEDFAVALEESVIAQERAIGILNQVLHRLDKLSAKMREEGAYPIADQIDRERRIIARHSSEYPNGR
jgi:hypothetical protein